MRFVDTSVWVAVSYVRDRWHETAFTLFADRTQSLVTSNLVIGERWTFLRRRTGHNDALRFVRGVQASPRVAIHSVERDIEGEAWEWLARHDERGYSFVDATSFAGMRRLRLTEALAFDGDFSAVHSWKSDHRSELSRR